MYVGFSASTGLYCWSLRIEGRTQDLDPRKLPFRMTMYNKVVLSKGFALGTTLVSVALVFLMIIAAFCIIFRIRDGDEILEDWEIEYGACRFKYSELFAAAGGFGEKSLAGKDEFLLVYDYVPNGSVDKLLYEDGVVHRDVKPSNVQIDEGLNEKLRDFGLARTYEHNNNPRTINIAGMLGYLAHELTKTGKAATRSDVYGYDTLMLEVASRRMPIEPQNRANELVVVIWVRELHCILKEISPEPLIRSSQLSFRPTMVFIWKFLQQLQSSQIADDPAYNISTLSQSKNSWTNFGKKISTVHAKNYLLDHIIIARNHQTCLLLGKPGYFP
ncbi:L-type lectin-domain containing receptor kinase IV.2-like [Hibiscus syriacus]|uniref:L-type lectin-domain containing receptor kinase IV.2-like n=1 Tax=Hibiscus syriacus TaxID=106335 RepID=UPI00192132AD|nr:L-type lectin-domain containing receptor kinase IV.2-like [Hibiscus syriacus]